MRVNFGLMCVSFHFKLIKNLISQPSRGLLNFDLILFSVSDIYLCWLCSFKYLIIKLLNYLYYTEHQFYYKCT